MSTPVWHPADLISSDRRIAGRLWALTNRIELNPRVMLGKDVIRGTRIPVELILRMLSEGASEAVLLAAYPGLTRADVHAAIRYAADMLAHEGVAFIDEGSSPSGPNFPPDVRRDR